MPVHARRSNKQTKPLHAQHHLPYKHKTNKEHLVLLALLLLMMMGKDLQAASHMHSTTLTGK
jgi:hypothetical protein